LPLLPGELSSDDQALLHRHYHKLIMAIHHTFSDAFERDQAGMLFGLQALLGFRNPNLIQLTCYHAAREQKRYELERIHLVDGKKRLAQLQQFTVESPSVDGASFALHFPWGSLQIRVKPMNKFTQAGYKINCSVREIFD